MGKFDAIKTAGRERTSRARLEALERNRPAVGRGPREATHGTAIVMTAVAFGAGSLCKVALMEGGRPIGLTVDDAVCQGARLAAGAVVQWVRLDDGTVELTAGGGGGDTNNQITQHVANYNGLIIPCGFNLP